MRSTKLITIILLSACSIFWTACSANKGDAVVSNKANVSPGGGNGTAAENVSANENKSNSPAPNDTSKTSSEIDSVYTDIAASKCKTIDSNEEEEWIVQECPGVGGFKLEVSEGDLRQTIDVISPSGKKSELDFSGKVSSGFSSLGEKAEWRVKKNGAKVLPYALITRFNVSENPDNAEKTTSYLIVSKISADTSCIVEVIKPISNANEKARVSADESAEKPCLKSR